MTSRTPTDIQVADGNAERAIEKDDAKHVGSVKRSTVEDLWKLALKIERLTKMVQQSVLLLMIFGIAVSCMWYGDLIHMYVLSLFTVCSYILLRWGLPKQ